MKERKGKWQKWTSGNHITAKTTSAALIWSDRPSPSDECHRSDDKSWSVHLKSQGLNYFSRNDIDFCIRWSSKITLPCPNPLVENK